MRYLLAVLLAVSLPTSPLLAQEKAATDKDSANQPFEEILIRGEADKRLYKLAETVDIAPDSTALLRKAVGANVVSNGPITGIAQYRGMSRFRISSKINGAVISPGGPNWMDAPLSYAPAAHLDSLEVYRGIAPVSAGQETIGGVINANTWSGDYSESGWALNGRLRTGVQSVNEASLMSGVLIVADENQRFRLSALDEAADDARFADGQILPSAYERRRFDFGYGWRHGRHTLQFDVGRSDTGDAGTPALPMDIQWIDSDLAGFDYAYAGADITLSSRVYYSNIDHGMTNYHLRSAPGSSAMFRRNVTDAENLGFSLSVAVAGWTVGLDGHNEIHNSDIDNPGNAMFFVRNFDHAERRVVGVFGERELLFDGGWEVQLGLRINHVTTDTRPVDATPAAMAMSPARALRDVFNAADRSLADTNVDWVARLDYTLDDQRTLYAGVSRKSRSPSYQERYLWLPLQATAGLADGRTYTGRVDLDPEVAHEIELGLDWQNGRFMLSPRIFYRDISDYVQGTVSTNMSAVMFVRMMNNMNGTANADPLEFNNVDATIYGADIDWHYRLSERWSLSGLVNYVRARRDDIDDNLYRVAAPNALVTVDYTAQDWGLALETFVYADQGHISVTNSEPQSDGYALLNLKGRWSVDEHLRFGFGVDNLLDEDYRDHLAGVNRVRGNPDVTTSERLPGYGRGVFARLDYEW